MKLPSKYFIIRINLIIQTSSLPFDWLWSLNFVPKIFGHSSHQEENVYLFDFFFVERNRLILKSNSNRFGCENKISLVLLKVFEENDPKWNFSLFSLKKKNEKKNGKPCKQFLKRFSLKNPEKNFLGIFPSES